MSDRLVLRALRIIADRTNLPTYDALNLADAIAKEFAPKQRNKGSLATATLDERVAFARTVDGVLRNLPDRKIQAIKALREASDLSLLDAKNTVDELDRRERAYPPF